MSGPAGSSQWIYTREFDILNSARFNRADSAFLEKTGSAGNRRTFTLSVWFKTHGRGVFQRLLESGANTQNQCLLTIDNGDKLRVTATGSNSAQMSFKTNLVTRDPTNWYHVVWAVDSTQGTAANRVNIYVNGMLQTSFETETYPSENADFHINTEVAHRIGSIVAGGDYMDGNMLIRERDDEDRFCAYNKCRLKDIDSSDTDKIANYNVIIIMARNNNGGAGTQLTWHSLAWGRTGTWPSTTPRATSPPKTRA